MNQLTNREKQAITGKNGKYFENKAHLILHRNS